MNYHDIKHCDMLNGSGLRVTLFVSGCDNKCKGCHNPSTWNPNSGIPFDNEAFNELIDSLDRNYISGVTLSGGDPMYPNNIECIYSIIKSIREKFNNSKNIWIYSGYTYEYLMNRDEVTKEILGMSDVLVDGRFMIELKDDDIHYRGSKNQRIIDLKSSNVNNIKLLNP